MHSPIGMAEKHALINGSPAMHPKQIEANSVNLVSEEFEKQYRDGVMEQTGRRRRRSVGLRVVWVALVVVAAWLAALTAVREVQLRRLQGEVRALAADLLAVSATLRTIQDNKFLKELQILDDPIYADEPESKTSDKSTSLDKLNDLTVVLDDDSNDRDVDDGLYDDEDDGDESGDWYQDYDKRERIGKTNMQRLKPDDFMDTVVLEEPSVSNIRKIKRLLNQNPETDIGTEAWHNIGLGKLSTSTERDPSSQERDRRSVLPGDFTSPNMVISEAERRKISKQSEDPAALKSAPAPHTVSRTARNSEMAQRIPFIAAHFHGNTSHLTPGIHQYYKGNGMMHVPHEAVHDVWSPAAWTQASPHPAKPTLTRKGHVHVHHTGIYLVYAQIYYVDRHDVISWVLHRTNPEQEGRDTLLQCAQSAHTFGEPIDKPNSCFSASALFLRAGDKLAIRNTSGDRHSLMQPEKSFIGLIKLADAEDPDDN